MSDETLTFGLLGLELGIPPALIVVHLRVPRFRWATAVLLGALSLALLLYARIVLGYLLHPTDLGARWAIGATWVMTFLPYAACLLLGLAWLRRPRHLALRYLLGFASPPPSPTDSSSSWLVPFPAKAAAAPSSAVPTYLHSAFVAYHSSLVTHHHLPTLSFPPNSPLQFPAPHSPCGTPGAPA